MQIVGVIGHEFLFITTDTGTCVVVFLKNHPKHKPACISLCCWIIDALKNHFSFLNIILLAKIFYNFSVVDWENETMRAHQTWDFKESKWCKLDQKFQLLLGFKKSRSQVADRKQSKVMTLTPTMNEARLKELSDMMWNSFNPVIIVGA